MEILRKTNLKAIGKELAKIPKPRIRSTRSNRMYECVGF